MDGRTDSTIVWDTAAVTIRVTDTNDNPPVFGQQLYSTTIPEDTASAVELTTVTASDADSGLNAELAYVTFWPNFHHFDRFELELRGHT